MKSNGAMSDILSAGYFFFVLNRFGCCCFGSNVQLKPVNHRFGKVCSMCDDWKKMLEKSYWPTGPASFQSYRPD